MPWEPSFESLLGPGVSASDVTTMRIRGTDRFAKDARISVRVVGAATRGDTSKSFDWVFRRSYEVTNCLAGRGFATTLKLTQGTTMDLRLEARGEELLRADADDAAALVFEPFAGADADADGKVTLDELHEAPAPRAAADRSGTLEALVYERSLPRVVRVLGGGPCETEQRGRRR